MHGAKNITIVRSHCNLSLHVTKHTQKLRNTQNLKTPRNNRTDHTQIFVDDHEQFHAMRTNIMHTLFINYLI